MQIQYHTDGISVNSPESSDFLESIFFHGNGYIGARGFSCEDESNRPHQKGLYMAGVYDELKPGITDIVNTPNFLCLTAKIGDQSLGTAVLSRFCQKLNFKDGVLTREYLATFDDKHLKVKISRFFNLSDVHSAAIRMELTPLDFKDELTVSAFIDSTSCNLPILDDQVKKNFETIQYLDQIDSVKIEHGGVMVYQTKATKISIVQAFNTRLSNNIQILSQQSNFTKDKFEYQVTFHGEPGEKYTIDKFITVFTSRDVPESQMKSEVLNRLIHNVNKGFKNILAENQKEWASRWETSDIVISGDNKAQCAIRYAIFQLICNNSCNDYNASIGARGLTHARYKGCYFWDTEIFMLPFYTYTNPKAARNLLLYRYNTLDAAKEHAKTMSSKGARYPWMASFDGSEQCESWDIGACEVHVTADISYAIDQYIKLADDTQFLLDYAAEIYIETARFWESRFTYNAERDQYNMLFVKGPDEYCGVTHNNTYTNIIAIHNLNLAINTLKLLKESYDNYYISLVKKTNLQNDEMVKWQEIIQKVVIPYDEEKALYIQDETILLMEPLDISSTKTNHIPLYHKISYDRLQRYRVLKQADLVLLMVLFPQKFSYLQKKAVWDFYEPITLHDSTLSFGTHAQLAANLDEKEKAWDYLYKSLFLDLENIMGNTEAEGLHFAAFGVAWQAVIYGIAGLSFENEIPKVYPKLPPTWQSLSFTIYYKNKKWPITITNNKCEINR